MSRKAVRLVLVFRKESAGWKISHCSYSIPDQLVREGEVDEEMILDLLTEMLGFLGYQVTTCEDGEEAVVKYKAGIESGKPFSAVIMDLTIPGGMGGKEAAEQILAIDPKASLIVSSGYSNDLIMSEYGSYGFIATVTKPYSFSKLSEIHPRSSETSAHRSR